MIQESKSSATESPVQASVGATELSEQELTAVTGGDGKSKTDPKTTKKGGDSSTSIGPVVISIIGVLIS